MKKIHWIFGYFVSFFFAFQLMKGSGTCAHKVLRQHRTNLHFNNMQQRGLSGSVGQCVSTACSDEAWLKAKCGPDVDEVLAGNVQTYGVGGARASTARVYVYSCESWFS